MSDYYDEDGNRLGRWESCDEETYIAADVILGVPYAVEELEDGINDTPAPTDAAPTTRRTARRAQRAAAEPIDTPEPDPTPEPEPVVEEPPTAVASEDGQLWPEPPADWTPEA